MVNGLNVIHLSTGDSLGAGFAAYRFHRNLLKSGASSTFFVQNKSSDDPSVVKLDLTPSKVDRLLDRIEKRTDTFDKDFYFFDKGRFSLNSIEPLLSRLEFEPDVVVLHWISRFVNPDILKMLDKQFSPSFYWYLMDMAPLTGGCHYAWDCRGYTRSCDGCPAISNQLYKNKPKKTMLRKSKAIEGLDITTLSASTHLVNQVSSSSLFKSCVNERLMLGVDSTIFKPGDKLKIKKKFGIDGNAKVLYFASSFNTEKRKGMDLLILALNELFKKTEYRDECVVLTAGHMSKEISKFSDLGVKHLHLGYLSGDVKLAEAYQLADIFLSPSIEDSGPMMVNESIVSGTPVVAFEMGVALDLVQSGVTGYLAELGNYKDFCIGIQSILELDIEERLKMSARCRSLGVRKSSTDSQIRDFYKILERNKIKK